jgi:hypothetical protein
MLNRSKINFFGFHRIELIFEKYTHVWGALEVTLKVTLKKIRAIAVYTCPSEKRLVMTRSRKRG